jgi:sugar phosphate isomerase/epimerase
MPHQLCLAHLSLIELSPPEMVTAAAAGGFDLVSLRLAPAAAGEPQRPMIGDTPMMRETLARLRSLGVAVHDVELVRLNADTDVSAYEPFMEAASRLGARQVLVAGDGDDEGSIADRFSALAQLGKRYGLRMGLEFMPWRGIRNLQSAARVVEAAASGGIVVDAIHLDRSGGSAADLASLRPEQWAFFQICDAPAQQPATEEELLFQARRARLAPGHGGLDLTGMLRALPRDLVISIEVPLHGYPDLLPPVPRARLLREATRLLMASAHVD